MVGVNILAYGLALPAILRNETFGVSFFDALVVFFILVSIIGGLEC